MWPTSPYLSAVLLSIVLIGTVSAARVCFICCCKPMVSSFLFMRNVAKGLYDRGHDVSLVLPDHLSTDQDKYAFTGANVIRYDSYSKEIHDLQKSLLDNSDAFGTLNISIMMELSSMLTQAVEVVLRDTSLLEKLKERNFDLFVLDGVPIQLSLIPYRLSLPFVYITPVYLPWKYGLPFSTSVVPFQLTSYSDKMTFIQRFLNTLLTIVSVVFDYWWDLEAVKRLSPDLPYISLPELNRKAELWIVLSDIILDYPRPTLPNVKLIGGLTVEEANQLPIRLKEFVESSQDGFIFMSLGSGNITLPDKVINIFIQAFSELQYNVIWRTHSKVDRNNILTVSWVNQNDILGNDNIKLYISHCGANGQYEALYHAVPTLCIPLFADQFYFAESVTKKGFGRALDQKFLSQSELQQVIVELINNSSITENLKRASGIMHSTGHLPRDEAAYWIEHVIKYGGSYMRSESQNIAWYKYLLLDIAIVCFVFVCGFIFACWTIVRCVIARKSMNSKTKTD